MKELYATMGDGQKIQVTTHQIRQAVKNKTAVIRWSHGQWRNIGRLHIYDTAAIATKESERDTQGQCWSVFDELWSELADDADRAIKAAAGLLIIS
jgi:enamine deaminase RidA (YjgF/YER057c/UK114 family)